MPYRAHETLASIRACGWASPAHMTFAGDRKDWEWRRISAHPNRRARQPRSSTERRARTTIPAVIWAAQALLGALLQPRHRSRRTDVGSPAAECPTRRSGARPVPHRRRYLGFRRDHPALRSSKSLHGRLEECPPTGMLLPPRSPRRFTWRYLRWPSPLPMRDRMASPASMHP